METQTWLSRYNKFISAENITILSISSDDFLHALLKEIYEQKRQTSNFIFAPSFKTIKFSNK